MIPVLFVAGKPAPPPAPTEPDGKWAGRPGAAAGGVALKGVRVAVPLGGTRALSASQAGAARDRAWPTQASAFLRSVREARGDLSDSACGPLTSWPTQQVPGSLWPVLPGGRLAVSRPWCQGGEKNPAEFS